MEYIAVLLVALNVFQLVYWSRQVHKLLDKLMSRNYNEYVLATKPNVASLPPQPEIQLEDTEELNLLNSVIAGL